VSNLASQVDKHELVLQLGVHYRDLRIVDPHVPTPYPSGIFLREKAMVLNLESLRYPPPPSPVVSSSKSPAIPKCLLN